MNGLVLVIVTDSNVPIGDIQGFQRNGGCKTENCRSTLGISGGTEPYAANRLEQCALATMGPVGAIRFCDHLNHWIQPPDAENRISGGMEGVLAAIPLPPPDHGLVSKDD
jgi:hypothetical protein